MNSIQQRLDALSIRMGSALAKAGRTKNSLTCIAVSKYQSEEAIRLAYEAGLTHFGENYLQEARYKQAQLSTLPLHWHFIGHIQRNKARAIATHFHMVHSVDSLRIAEALNHYRTASLTPLPICIQVNISHEASKSGVAPERAYDLAAQIQSLPYLHLRGLMVIPALTTADPALERTAFAEAHACFTTINTKGIPLDILSMGMSNDFEAAILEGATHIRIGTGLFGERHS